MAKGGLTKGKSHKEGGMPMVVKSTGQKVELEGGEGVINKHTMSDDEKYDFEGKKLTACEIASKLNQEKGGGVPFKCEETADTDLSVMEKGGKVPIKKLQSEQKHLIKSVDMVGNIAVLLDAMGEYDGIDRKYPSLAYALQTLSDRRNEIDAEVRKAGAKSMVGKKKKFDLFKQLETANKVIYQSALDGKVGVFTNKGILINPKSYKFEDTSGRLFLVVEADTFYDFQYDLVGVKYTNYRFILPLYKKNQDFNSNWQDQPSPMLDGFIADAEGSLIPTRATTQTDVKLNNIVRFDSYYPSAFGKKASVLYNGWSGDLSNKKLVDYNKVWTFDLYGVLSGNASTLIRTKFQTEVTETSFKIISNTHTTDVIGFKADSVEIYAFKEEQDWRLITSMTSGMGVMSINETGSVEEVEKYINERLADNSSLLKYELPNGFMLRAVGGKDYIEDSSGYLTNFDGASTSVYNLILNAINYKNKTS